MDKEVILRYVTKNVTSNGDLYYIISVLFRIYINNITQDQILKFVDNSYQHINKTEENTGSKFIDIIDSITSNK